MGQERHSPCCNCEACQKLRAAEFIKSYGVSPGMAAVAAGPYNTPILNAREKTHGDYKISARTAQELKGALRLGNYESLKPYQRESLDLICTKISRILSGNPDERDHWDDIAGYAKLVSERLTAAPSSSG